MKNKKIYSILLCFITLLFAVGLTSCPPPVTEFDFANYDVAKLFKFADGDSKDSVTQPFNVTTKDGDINIEFNAPDYLVFNEGTFTIDWPLVTKQNLEAIITCKVSKGTSFAFKEFMVILNRKLGLVSLDELVTFSNIDDSFELVMNNFKLAKKVPRYEENITWSGFEACPSILSYNSATGNVTVTRGSVVNTVTLYATFSKDGFDSVTKEFTLTIADDSMAYSYAPTNIDSLITLASGDFLNRISQNFNVATLIPSDGFHGDVNIAWSANPSSAITFNGEVATLNTSGSQVVNVTLQAIFTEGSNIAVKRTRIITIDPNSYAPQALEGLIALGNSGKDYMWRIRANFAVATEIPASATNSAVTVSWSSSDSSVVSFNNGAAKVTRSLSSKPVTFTATFKEGSREPVTKSCKALVMEQIDDTLTVDGVEYKLIYFDPFDNMEILKANWDIGNPGNDGSKLVGNPGGNPVYYKSPDGQFHGYANEQKKWPLWSPRAVRIVDGRLFLDIKYDNEINRGVVGAVFSMRRFPYGLYVARWSENQRKHTNHWDAFWLDTNHPFSKAQGKKVLNLPKALRSKVAPDPDFGEGFFNYNASNIQKGNNNVSTPIMYQSSYNLVTNSQQNGNWNFTAAKESGTIGRFYNGEQRYELDIFELPYADNRKPSSVGHFWHWFRANPGNNPNDPWGPGEVPRNAGKIELSSYSREITKDYVGSTFFTFSGLYSPNKIAFYTSGDQKPDYSSAHHSFNNKNGKVNNSDIIWPNDEFNPIEVLFSIEPGTNWFGNSGVPNGEPYKSGHVDYMEIEYFAFYAPSNALVNKNIGDASGVALTPITNFDNVKESAATQAKLTEEYK